MALRNTDRVYPLGLVIFSQHLQPRVPLPRKKGAAGAVKANEADHTRAYFFPGP